MLERKDFSLVTKSHGSSPVLSLHCLYTQAALLAPLPKRRLPLHSLRTRAAPPSHTASVSGAVTVNSPRSGRFGVPPRAATSTRQTGVCPPPPCHWGQHFRPPSSLSRPRPCVHRANAADASMLAAGWARRPRRQIIHIRPSPHRSSSGTVLTCSGPREGAAGDYLVR